MNAIPKAATPLANPFFVITLMTTQKITDAKREDTKDRFIDISDEETIKLIINPTSKPNKIPRDKLTTSIEKVTLNAISEISIILMGIIIAIKKTDKSTIKLFFVIMGVFWLINLSAYMIK
jgi:hypothetical protein